MATTSPNQREILVNKSIEKGSKKPYMIIYTDILEAAACELTPVALKLFLYLASNQDNYRAAFSSAHFAEVYGCDRRSIKAAWDLLEAKGYIKQSNEKKNLFIFSEKPTVVTALPSNIAKNMERRTFVDVDTNTEYKFTYDELLDVCENDEAIAKELWEGSK